MSKTPDDNTFEDDGKKAAADEGEKKESATMEDLYQEKMSAYAPASKKAPKHRDERARLNNDDEEDMVNGRGSMHRRGTARGLKKPESVASASFTGEDSKPSASLPPATKPGAVAVGAPLEDQEPSKMRLGTFSVRTPSDRNLMEEQVASSSRATESASTAATSKTRSAAIAMPEHEEYDNGRATKPGAVAAISVPHQDDEYYNDGKKKPKSGGGSDVRRESRPGAVSMQGLNDEYNPRLAYDSGELYNNDQHTPHIVAHLVDEEAVQHPSTSKGQIDEDMPVAVAERDSFWSLLRHDRRTKIIAILILVAIVGLGVGLGVSASKNNDSSGFEDVPDETYLQAGSNIDGPDKFFKYGSGQGSKFGAATAISGDGKFLAVGAPKFKGVINGEEHENLGLVQLFQEVDSDWALMEPSIPGEVAGDRTGAAVGFSLDGTTVAICSPGYANNKGQVKVYKRNGAEWMLKGKALVGDEEGDGLGTSVGVSQDGQRVAVGLLAPSNGGPNERAKVFDFDIGIEDWVPLGSDLEGHFGGNPISLSPDGSTIAMGSMSTPENNFLALLKVYEYGDATGDWTLRGKEIPMQGAEGSYHTGWSASLSMDGKTVAIGTSVENAQKEEEYDLKVLVYHFDETGNWVQLGLTQHDKTGSHLIAYRVVLSADAQVMAIGDPGGFAMGIKSGHTHVLRWQNEEWFHITKELEGTDAADLFGEALGMTADGNRVCIGAPQSRATGTELGRVQIFELADV